MRVICSAVVQDQRQKEILCGKVSYLNGVPILFGRSVVSVDYEGEGPQAEKFIELFEEYTRHEIIIQE